MHFCGKHLKSFSLTGKAKNCFELAKIAKCSKHAQAVVEMPDCERSKKDCCHNKTLNLKADLTSDFPTNDFLISTQLQSFVIAFIAIYLEDCPPETDIPNFLHYKPPLIPKDIPVLIQSFLL